MISFLKDKKYIIMCTKFGCSREDRLFPIINIDIITILP